MSAPIKAPDAPHIETEAEKKLAEEVEKVKGEMGEFDKLDTN